MAGEDSVFWGGSEGGRGGGRGGGKEETRRKGGRREYGDTYHFVKTTQKNNCVIFDDTYSLLLGLLLVQLRRTTYIVHVLQLSSTGLHT